MPDIRRSYQMFTLSNSSQTPCSFRSPRYNIYSTCQLFTKLSAAAFDRLSTFEVAPLHGVLYLTNKRVQAKYKHYTLIVTNLFLTFVINVIFIICIIRYLSTEFRRLIFRKHRFKLINIKICLFAMYKFIRILIPSGMEIYP